MSEETTNALTGLPLTNDELANIARLAETQIRLEKLVELREAELAHAKATLHEHSFRTLPEAMNAVGMASFTLKSGESITVEPIVTAKIPDAKENPELRKKAFEWLREHKHDGIIKSFLSFRFDRGSSKEKVRLLEYLKADQFPVKPEEKDDVHWQTLRAFVKEQLAAGNHIPPELFGIFVGTRACVVGK